MNDVKRLIIVGLGVIMAILLCLFIKNHADTDGWKTAYKYHIAITANKKDEFNYDVDSKQGLVLSRGEFTTPVGTKFDEMTKVYTYVDKIHQHYTMHVQTYSCGKSTCTRVYYSWDNVGDEERFAPKTKYLDRSYDTTLFGFHNFVEDIDACDITAKDTSGFFGTKHGCDSGWGSSYYYQDNSDRYYYQAVPLEFTASFITDTSNGTLKSPFGKHVSLEKRSTEQMVKDSTGYQFWNNFGLVIGAIMMLVFGGILGYNWVMADGKWSLNE
jgi:hypothetical protein